MKYKEMDRLQKAVYRIMISDAGNYSNLDSMESDYSHGCASGIIGELIYCSDTTAWYKRYKMEISRLLVLCGYSVKDINKFDEDDPLCLDIHNQNQLAWFSFDATASELFYDDDVRKALSRKLAK